ncbi:3'-5' exonuclease family protein [Paludibacterium paludis]|uniref:DNA-directed DNA polymerase n=1 Tax=Paludibacterium paludis TaxID=1225769 RepID=A0A918U7E1_9NEIS|nr:3'-5' exonuclease family protein [Paludibacterium paludis]GGY02933.1 DNA polymerase III subunit epsilon [Paludibacterium paludis]
MLFDRPCAIVDLETTGGHITRDRITEIGILFIDGECVERFESLVNPGKPIPPFIERMTGISDDMVGQAPEFASLAEELWERLQGRLLIAHNVRFDYGFLKNEFRRAGLTFQSDLLCTVKLSRRLYPAFFKHSLDSLIERHGLSLPSRHRAMADAEAVYLFLGHAARELGDETVAREVARLAARPVAPPGLDPEVMDRLPDMPGVYLFFGDDDMPLYVGSADNIRSRVLAHFSEGKGKERHARIPRTIRRVEWRETLGEFGSHLMELRLVRSLEPLVNVRGRANKDLCSLQLAEGEDGFVVPRMVYAEDVDFSRVDALYGLFGNAREARRVLKDLAEAHKLCQARLGVETVTSRKGRPCSAHAVGKCRGACIGKEPAMQHNARLMSALARLKVKSWPYPGAVVIEESDEVTGEMVEHVFDRWCYLGSRVKGGDSLEGVPMFDRDIYKLFTAWMKKPQANTALRLLEE